MKRFFTLIFTVFSIALSCYARDENKEILFDQNFIPGDLPAFRAPALVPLQGYYDSSAHVICITFRYPMGTLTYQIDDLNAGTQLKGKVSSDLGMAIIPFSGIPGTLYRITFKTEEGQEYLGTLLID